MAASPGMMADVMDLQQTLTNAAAHARAKRWAEAETLYREILAQKPDHAEALHLLGCATSRQGRSAEGAELMRRAIAIDPKQSAYHNNLGVVLVAMGKTREAILAFRAAIDCQPDSLVTYYHLGNTLCGVGQFGQAVPYFEHLVVARPNEPQYHYVLGQCWSCKAGAMGQMTASSPPAIVAERKHAMERAAACLQQALALKPDFEQAGNSLANVLRALGRLDEADAVKNKITKRAFLVLGPESCGNRIVTQCLIAAGCDGDPEHEQRFDKPDGLFGASHLIVWRRSLPHGRAWPDLYGILERLRLNGYADVRVFAVLRTHYCAVRSQVDGREKHAVSYDEAERNIAGALRRIASFVLENNLPVRWITYESIVDPQQRPTFLRVLEEWGLDTSRLPEISDENAKYLLEVDKSEVNMVGP